MTASRSLRPGDRVLTIVGLSGTVYRAPARNTPYGEVREVRYAYPAGNKGMARTFIEFTDGTSGEYPTNASWIVED